MNNNWDVSACCGRDTCREGKLEAVSSVETIFASHAKKEYI